MQIVEPEIEFMSPENLLRIADRYVLESFQREQNVEGRIQNTRLTISPSIQHKLTLALKKLDRVEKHLIDLHFKSNLDFDEISTLVNISPGKVEVRIKKAIGKLRIILLLLHDNPRPEEDAKCLG